MARSDDRGLTWTPTFLDAGVGSIAFATRDKGFAVGGDRVVFRTDDGGASWMRQTSGIELPAEETAQGIVFNQVRFLDELRGVIAGVGATNQVIGVFGPGTIYATVAVILLTEDGGETWIPAAIDVPSVPSPTFEGGPSARVFSVCFTGAGIGLVAGEPNLLSHDGGRSWQNIDDRLPRPDGWGQAECHGDATLWLGTVDFARSDDGGETWRRLTPPSGFTCCGGAADWVTETLAWSYTDHLLRTFDGATTWEDVETPPPPGAFNVLEFASPEVGVWAGDGGAWVTHDAGESWTFATIVPLERKFRIADVVVVE